MISLKAPYPFMIIVFECDEVLMDIILVRSKIPSLVAVSKDLMFLLSTN